ncbi:MAG TPA: hypothetical protein VL475_05385, partial [Planctomycetaceae bacterium]|nr:hypothetical protein [Planctomycetaceae bacterium]
DAKPVERVVSIPRKPAPLPTESGDEEQALEAHRPEPADDVEPLTLPPRRETSASAIDVASNSRPGQASDPSHEEEDDDDAWTESFPKPDMRGMSKKQRRRLMQELREKERAQRRQSGRD